MVHWQPRPDWALLTCLLFRIFYTKSSSNNELSPVLSIQFDIPPTFFSRVSRFVFHYDNSSNRTRSKCLVCHDSARNALQNFIIFKILFSLALPLSPALLTLTEWTPWIRAHKRYYSPSQYLRSHRLLFSVSVQINFPTMSTCGKNKLLPLRGREIALKLRSVWEYMRKCDKVPSGQKRNETKTQREQKPANNNTETL